MPTFRYQAYGARGELAEGDIEAASEEVAGNLLWARGLTAFRMRPAERGGARRWWQRELFSADGSRKDLAAFTREFATLNTAEIPLDDTLRILADQANSPGMRALAADLLADVLNGSTLSDAMGRQPKMFPGDYVSVVRAGEIGGTVAEVLAELADLLERRLEIRARIHSALVYPAILVVLTLVSLAIVIGSLVPSIAPVFSEGGHPMPPALGFIISMQSKWREIAVTLVLVVSATAGGTAMALRRPAARVAFDRWKLKLPVYGSFTLHQDTARFCRTLGTMLRAGVPLLTASASARTVIANRHVGAGLDAAIGAIRAGVALHRALRSETALPAVALRMISVGEEAGKLDRMLVRVAAMFEQQTQRDIERFMAVLTPLLTVSIAVLVGGLIMTVISAILSMNDLAFR